jgi:hypothetical protein
MMISTFKLHRNHGGVATTNGQEWQPIAFPDFLPAEAVAAEYDNYFGFYTLADGNKVEFDSPMRRAAREWLHEQEPKREPISHHPTLPEVTEPVYRPPEPPVALEHKSESVE